MIDLLGLAEIAELLGIRRASVDQLRWRGVLPEPDAMVSGRPLWHRETIERWARETGRQLPDA